MDLQALQTTNKIADEAFERTLAQNGAALTPTGDAVQLVDGQAFAWRVPAVFADQDRLAENCLFGWTTSLALLAAAHSARCQKIEADDRLTDIAKATDKQKLLAEVIPTVKSKLAKIDESFAKLETEERAFYAPGYPSETDTLTVMRDYEVRQAFAALDMKSRLAFAEQHAGNRKIISALVRSPLPYEPEVTKYIDHVFRELQDAANPDRSKQLKRWRESAEFARERSTQAAETFAAATNIKRRDLRRAFNRAAWKPQPMRWP